MKRGLRCSGDKKELKSSLNYHWDDRRNRMYLCGCFRSFRSGGKIKPGFSNTIIYLSNGDIIVPRNRRMK